MDTPLYFMAFLISVGHTVGFLAPPPPLMLDDRNNLAGPWVETPHSEPPIFLSAL